MTTGLDLPLLLALLCGHLVGDFVLQTEAMVRGKGRPLPLLAHVSLVGAATYLFAGVWSAWWLVLAIVALHALTDWLKVRIDPRSMTAFWIDQAVHIAVVVAAAWVAPRCGFGGSWWEARFGSQIVHRVLIFVMGLVVTVRMGGIVVSMAVAPYLPTVQNGGEVSSALQTRERGLIKGGWLIGQLERGLIFFLVMIGRPESVAFLVAAKSVFRFGELRDPANRVEAEYILIGTLMSFTWGLVAAWLTRALLG